MINRFVFNNLIYRLPSGQILLMNMISFRRMIITENQLKDLKQIEGILQKGSPLSEDLNNYYLQLVNVKQILTQDMVYKADSILENQFEEKLKNFIPRISEITLNITHHCNFNCDYCYQNSYKHESNYTGTMKEEEIDQIMQFLLCQDSSFTELDTLVLSGGEPLLPEMVKTIDYIIDTIPAKQRILFSNGMNILLLRDQIPFSKIDAYQISLDGPDYVFTTVNHSNSKMDNVLDGIQYLLSLGKTVSLSTIWTPALANTLDEFIGKIKESGILNNPNFRINTSVATDYKTGDVLHRGMYNNWDSLIQDHIKYHSLLNEIHTNFSLNNELTQFAEAIHRPLNEMFAHRVQRCNPHKSLPLVFEPNGEIHWCLCLGKVNGLLGNYKTKEWEKEKIDSYIKRSVFSLNKCKTCPMRYICGGGCPLIKIGLGYEGDKTPSCGIFEDEYFWNNLERFV